MTYILYSLFKVMFYICVTPEWVTEISRLFEEL